jgi:hypothetical protein
MVSLMASSTSLVRSDLVAHRKSSFSIQQMNDETLEVIEQPCGGGCCLCVHGIFFPYFALLSIITCNIDFVINMLSFPSASLIKFVKNPDKSVDCHIKTKSGFKSTNGYPFEQRRGERNQRRYEKCFGRIAKAKPIEGKTKAKIGFSENEKDGAANAVIYGIR